MSYRIPYTIKKAADPLPDEGPQEPSASEGTHPLVMSPEEGLFAVPQEAVVKQLQAIISLKYMKVITYINYADRLRGHYSSAVSEHFNEHIDHERAHLSDLTIKLTALGGEPAPKLSGTPLDTADVHQMITAVLQYEKEAVFELRKLASMAGENISLRAFAEEIAVRDMRHADDMRRMLICVP